MSVSQTFTRTWSSNGEQISKAVTVSSGGAAIIDEVIAPAAADALVAFVADVSQLKGLYITASAAMTIETNSAGSPVNVFTLVTDTPFMWVNGDAPLRDTAGTTVTTDITALYVTSTDGGTLQIRTLIDPTL